jgi:multidrug resistance efflux pump
VNYKSVFKITFGIILVLLITSGLVMWFDERRSVATSTEAELTAESYTVGIDHSGTVTTRFVEPGDYVEAGQTLFQIKSTSLREQIVTLGLEESDLLYPLTDDGEILLQATRPGIVSNIEYNQGSFVPANEQIATIIDTSSLQVLATFSLARRDFNILGTDTQLDVRLPNGAWSSGTVRNIKVVEQEGQKVVVQLTAAMTIEDENNIQTANNVPVETRIKLNGKTLYSRLKQTVVAVF